MRLIRDLHKALWTPAPPDRPRALRWLRQAGRMSELYAVAQRVKERKGSGLDEVMIKMEEII